MQSIFSANGAEQSPSLLRQRVDVLTGCGTLGQLLLELAQTVIEDADLAVVALEARLGHGDIVLTHGLERSIEALISRCGCREIS